ncbi:MAG TPA: 2-oxo acid dehydrogenase subunit E2 [Kofleriaceae bacterium]|nr:2-oxo acid dehydrogenase subunit E2 [Kofleriaceae bacterium]
MLGPHDGRRVEVHPYRRMMSFLMRGRNESAVYLEHRLDLTRAQPWLEQRGARLFPLILHALATTLHERERLNRFTVGHRTYQRKGVFLSFAAKKAMSEDAPLATIKREFVAGETFDQVRASLGDEISEARSDKPSHIDKELSVLLKIPGFILAFLIGMLARLYKWGLAPRSLVDTDPMYASAFLANLGSLKMDAAYHHLYEHGNCPLFLTVGQVHPEPAVIDGALVVRPTVTVRVTFDERVEDGLYAAHALKLFSQKVEDPGSWIA